MRPGIVSRGVVQEKQNEKRTKPRRGRGTDRSFVLIARVARVPVL